MAARQLVTGFLNPSRIYAGTIVSILGASSSTLLQLYATPTGNGQIANPFQLDADGRSPQDVYVEVDYRIRTQNPQRGFDYTSGVIAVIAGSSGFVTPEHDYGAIGDGVADDTAAITNFLQAVQGTGANGVLNGSYRVTSPLPDVTDSLILIGGGEIYVDSSATPWSGQTLRVRHDPVETLTVSAIAATTVDFGGQGNLSATSRLTLASASTTLAAGSICRIVSDDSIPWAQANNHLGESFVAGSYDAVNNYLYTTQPLRYSYSTNIKVVVLDTTKQLSITGLRFRGNWSDISANNRSFTFLEALNVYAPKFSLMGFRDGAHSALVLRGCVAGEVFASDFRRMLNNGSQGYGVYDASSDFTRVVGCYFDDCRHGYTAQSQVSDANPWTHGVARSAIVQACLARACSGAGYDCHSGSDGIEFSACRSEDHYYGNSSGGVGLQANGIKHRIAGLTVSNTATGVAIGGDFEGDGQGISLQDLRATVSGDPIRVVRSAGPSSRIACRIRGARVETSNLTAITLQDADVLLDGNVTIVHTPTADFARAVQMTRASLKTARGCALRWDVSGAAGASPRMATIATTACTLDVDADVVAGAVAWDSFAEASGSAATVKVQARVDKAPATANGLNSVAGSGNWVTYKDGARIGSVRVARTQANTTIDVDGRGDATVLLLYTCASGCAIAAANACAYVGQRVVLANHQSSAGNVVLTNTPASKLVTGSTVTVLPGTAVEFVWDDDGVNQYLRLTSASVSGAGITGIDLKLDGVNQATGVTAVNFLDADFDYTSSKIALQASGTGAVLRQTWTADVAAAGFKLTQALLKTYSEVVQTIVTASGTATVNYSNGNHVSITTTENITTWTVNNLPSSSTARWTITFAIKLGGSHTIAVPAAWKTAGAVAYTASSSGNTDLLQLTGVGGDTTYMLFVTKGFAL